MSIIIIRAIARKQTRKFGFFNLLVREFFGKKQEKNFKRKK